MAAQLLVKHVDPEAFANSVQIRDMIAELLDRINLLLQEFGL